MARRTAKEQRFRRQERRQQKIAERNYQHYRYIDAVSNDATLTNRQKAEIMQGRLEIYEANRTKPAEGLQHLTYNERTEKGALIKQYYEYVDKGWIRPQSFMDVYDAAEYMSQNVSAADMEKAIQQADEWRTQTFQREMARRAERAANRPVIDF